jgi:phosphate transport system substrate-binding protein
LGVQNAVIVTFASLSLWLAGSMGAHAESLRGGGTGAALETMRRLAGAFARSEPDISIEIIEGLGSSGGIAAVAGGAIDFSISGRPLGAADNQSLQASIIARTPFGLVSSNRNPGDLASTAVADLFAAANAAWPDGKPVRLILRPKSDSDSQLLANFFPNMTAVLEKTRARAEIPVAATDQDNATLAERLAGSLTAMTLAQLRTESRDIYFLNIDGVAPTLENFESGRYPYGKDLYLVMRYRTTPALDRFAGFLRSPEGRNVLRANGSLPARP